MLCLLVRHLIICLALVQPRTTETHPNMNKNALTGMQSINTNMPNQILAKETTEQTILKR